ncbi:hypothetical protein SAMN06265795_101455 [Noviherbaspirillum humi]|uniref:Virulence factor n=2 Tax=Noviherbaspirillum humi TaxID=1688639 RepID=A0A239CI43_9BURK|nr:hypothetical protein SAMN06265795_101455 [Noviherbaspirillum humi]
MKALKWPLLFGLLSIVATMAWSHNEAQAEEKQAQEVALLQARQHKEREKLEEAKAAQHGFAAQVVGLQWLNPLMRRSYPTEWNLLWTLGLAKPNKNDELVKENPAKFNTIQPVSGIAFNMQGKATIPGFFHLYVEELFIKYRVPYFTDGRYFYTVQPDWKRNWREVGSIHVQAALPVTLEADESRDFIQKEIASTFSIGKPEMSTAKAPPDVNVRQGGPTIGFASLDAALDYLETHPDKTVWVMSFDAPSFPKDEQLNESSTLLILAHPSYKTEREPLAFIHRVSRRQADEFTVQAAEPPRLQQAWQAAINDAAQRGKLQTTQIGYVIHDAGMGLEENSKRLAGLSAALMHAMPEFDYLKQTFNTPALLGDMGAGTALTNVALGIAYAHHRNTPVLVAGTAQAGSATAVLIRPPQNPTPFDPEKTWFRARGEGVAYLPWWGRRHDASPTRMQGWSD